MRYITVSKKAILAFFLSVLTICTLTAGVGISESSRVFLGRTNKLLPIYSVETSEKKVALTFDAAWGTDNTLGILDTLKEYDVPATFFLVGFWTEKYPDLVREMDTRGIEIGTHSNTHPNMPKLSENNMRLELETSMKSIENITGKPVSLFRPPFGDYSDKLLTVCSDMKLSTIQWDVDSLDWKDLSAEQIANRIIGGAQNGSIVLMHNQGKHTLKALPLIINGLKNKGFSFSTVGDLIYKDNFHIDHTGRQILNT